MRLTDAGILFAIIFLCFILLSDARTNRLNMIAEMQIQYDNAIDNAVEDAMLRMVETDSGRAAAFNRNDAVERFFSGLFINMGVMDNPGLKNQLRVFIPVVAVIDRDGFWVCYHGAMEDGLSEMGFSEKYRYTWEDDQFRIDYTLSEYVYVTDKITNKKLEGNYHDVREMLPSELLSDENFDRTRRDTIIRKLTEVLTFYFNRHNGIARHYGITYQFALPVIEKEDWYRTIDDISILAILQGYPIGGRDSLGLYNRVAFSGARVRKVSENLQN